ncbi:Cytosol aminopeptidase PepA [Mesoplasma florum W37]|uniref:Probable cytosol aminopeptidase n=1 Tax=Mesoplasma florum TaxID=2151 RepID=A0AAD2PSJ0_MESFO|nr:M17 family metallopeptidase [Mesoplasma florum]AGY41141.1 Cytosol aminopeptidase PepA [Mesoplasma florum W37]AVN59372.1 peptidase M17 [Mesoplasma florum]AVN65479.1 Cytosol aminopeptidase PepA [Mesoplasma florum]
MIQINATKNTIKIVGVKDNSKNVFIKNKVGVPTLISEDKTIYIVFKKDEETFTEQIKKGIEATISNFEFDVDIDIDSFENVCDGISKEEIIKTVYETISFSTHKGLSIEKVEKEVKYNLIFTGKHQELINQLTIVCEYINYARDLQDTPPNIGTSEYYADKLVSDAKDIKGLKVTILGRKEATKLNMGLFLGVNAGSAHEPRIVVMEYCSDDSKPKTGLVGKGICFDSGGYNLKPSNYMEGMKFDMSGAAVVLSATMALAKAKAKANIVAVGMFTDNKIGQNATLPDSVIKSMSGKKVLIFDTDAEGRLVLADGISYVVKEKQVDQVIDASTLTGTVLFALGHNATGAFSHSDKMINELNEASQKSGERFWRLPIFKEHLKQVKKDAAPLADLTNACRVRYEDCSYAAAFLNEFAENKPFLHLDIAGTADKENKGQGVLVKTLFEMLK